MPVVTIIKMIKNGEFTFQFLFQSRNMAQLLLQCLSSILAILYLFTQKVNRLFQRRTTIAYPLGPFFAVLITSLIPSPSGEFPAVSLDYWLS